MTPNTDCVSQLIDSESDGRLLKKVAVAFWATIITLYLGYPEGTTLLTNPPYPKKGPVHVVCAQVL